MHSFHRADAQGFKSIRELLAPQIRMEIVDINRIYRERKAGRMRIIIAVCHAAGYFI